MSKEFIDCSPHTETTSDWELLSRFGLGVSDLMQDEKPLCFMDVNEHVFLMSAERMLWIGERMCKRSREFMQEREASPVTESGTCCVCGKESDTTNAALLNSGAWIHEGDCKP